MGHRPASVLLEERSRQKRIIAHWTICTFSRSNLLHLRADVQRTTLQASYRFLESSSNRVQIELWINVFSRLFFLETSRRSRRCVSCYSHIRFFFQQYRFDIFSRTRTGWSMQKRFRSCSRASMRIVCGIFARRDGIERKP